MGRVSVDGIATTAVHYRDSTGNREHFPKAIGHTKLLCLTHTLVSATDGDDSFLLIEVTYFVLHLL